MINKFACLVLLFFVGKASAQNIGIGTNTPNSKLDINGDIALRSTNINIASTYTYALDVNTAKQANYRLIDTNVTAVGNFIIAGITAGADGRQITLYNRTGSSMQLYDEDATALTADRIRTGIGTALAVYSGGAVMLRYDTSINRWEVLGSHYSSLDYFGGDAGWSLTGNTGTTSANFIGTNDDQPLRFRINGGSAGIIDSSLGNTSLGVAALRNNSTGFNNIAIGANALKSNIHYAQNNVAIGAGALENNIYAEGHVAIGYQALQNYTNINFPAGTFGANHNTAVGYKTLQNNAASGTSNTAVGGLALKENTTGFNNTAVGDFAMWKNTTGNKNVALGTETLYDNLEGYDNVAIGYSSLHQNKDSRNIAIGSQALYSNVTGYNNTSVGFQALYGNVYGYNNTSVGSYALKNITYSENNTAVGAFALVAGGYRCTAIGSFALNVNQAVDNVAIGMQSQGNNTSGVENTSGGNFSLISNISGSNNVAIGYLSIGYNTTGSRNVALGYKSLASISSTACAYSTAVGNESGPSSGNYTNSISIGHDSHSNGTDRAEIGSTFMQLIGGYKPWTTLVSDGRFKKNVQHDVKGLDFIMQLQPVTYTVDYHALEKFKGIPSFEQTLLRNDSLHKVTPAEIESVHKMQTDKEASLKSAEATIQNGFIAQEVLKAAENCGYQFDGVNKPQHDKDNYSIAYSQFVVPLVKAVQEQQEMIKGQHEMIQQLQQQNRALLKRIEKLEHK